MHLLYFERLVDIQVDNTLRRGITKKLTRFNYKYH